MKKGWGVGRIWTEKALGGGDVMRSEGGRQLGKFRIELGWNVTFEWCWGEMYLDLVIRQGCEGEGGVFQSHDVVFCMEVTVEVSHVLLN